jgi:hypothetical protein
VLRKILEALGIGSKPSAEPKPLPITRHRSIRRNLASEPPQGRPPKAASRVMRIRPYHDETCNFIYNLLFCDNPELFASSGAESWLTTLLAGSPDRAALRTIADGAATYDSRIRMLAFNRLREKGEPVPARVLLGVIVEVPLDEGLDTLAAFEDGGVRYINHSEKMSFFEGSGHPLDAQVQALLTVSQNAVNEIGPWTEARLPPPSRGMVRMSFLVSDGLYFGQGPMDEMLTDPMGGPIITASHALLQAIVEHQKSA